MRHFTVFFIFLSFSLFGEGIPVRHFTQNLTGSISRHQNREETLRCLKERIIFNNEKIRDILLDNFPSESHEMEILFHYEKGPLIIADIFSKLKYLENRNEIICSNEGAIYEIKGLLEYNYFLILLHNKIKNSLLKEF